MGILVWTVVLVLRIHGVLSACLSHEQFLASLDGSATAIFEAELINHLATQNALVRIIRFHQQPKHGWTISLGNAVQIQGIRPRPVDPISCLPELRIGRRYLWVTYDKLIGNGDGEDYLYLYPGGLFNVNNREDMWMSGDRQLQKRTPEQPQQDAALGQYEPFIANVIQSEVCDTLPCPLVLKPVCGMDGVLYQNECFMKIRACKQRTSERLPVSVDELNRCREEVINDRYGHTAVLCSSGNLCNYDALCLSNQSTSMQSFVASCDCGHIRCSGERPSAVCATDGQTYANECYMRKAMCVTQSVKRVQYYGTCASNPCLGHSCRWPGEKCEVDPSGQPKCVCPEPCPAVMIPVCGNDGITYDSHCHLERNACLKMRKSWVVHAGECSDESQCRTMGLYCQGYEICSRVPLREQYHDRDSIRILGTADGTVAKCTCPQCPENGLGEKVCGTDGKTYRSECHSRAHACEYQLYEVKVRSRGPCEACSNKQCRFYAICQRNVDGEPECICPTDCPYTGNNGQRVCGSDGETYENECHLKVRSCAEQREIIVANPGPCKPCPLGCPLGYRCHNGECVCRDACPPSNGLEAEVCGSNGQWYRSECELKRQACVQSVRIDIDPSGARCKRPAKDDSFVLPQADQFAVPACTCNKHGSLSEYCDLAGKCHCKPGAVGEKCDQCAIGYWGILNGHHCIDCSCHQYGAIGINCDQSTGQCQCRPGILGRQCSICPDNERLSPSGCIKESDHPDLQVDPPPEVDTILDKLEPDKDEQKLAGRLFSQQTTLLVRAPTSLDQPITVELLIVPSGDDGIIMQYRVPPTEQDQLLMTNLHDHQFSLLFTGKRVECNYLDGRSPNRLLVVQSREVLRPNVPYTIRAGISGSRPWVQIDSSKPTGLSEVGTRWVAHNGQDALHMGGYGTMVIGRPVLSMVQSTKSPSGALLTDGFTGCLLKLRIQTGLQKTEHEVDLISGDRTYLAWIGVDRLSSGLYEAPICTAIMQPVSRSKNMLQSDAQNLRNRCENEMPCRNDGRCLPMTDAQFECVCQPGWQGKTCEEEVTVIPQFDGSSFVRLPGPGGRQAMQRKRFSVVLTVLVSKAKGLIFYIPPSGFDHTGPFIAVYVDKEMHPVVICRVGSTAVSKYYPEPHSRIVHLRYHTPLQLDKWHRITIDKLPKVMKVQVDRLKTQKIIILSNQFGRIPRKIKLQLSKFDLSKSPIYLGGYPFELDPIDFIGIQHGLVGAIQKVMINGAEAVLGGPPSQPIQLEKPLSPTEFWQNTSQWQGPPCGPLYSPCNMDHVRSICHPQIDKATCSCARPSKLLKILADLGGGNQHENAEKIACEQRQKELLIEKDRYESVDLGRQALSDIQYDSQHMGTADSIKNEDGAEKTRCGVGAIRHSGNSRVAYADLVKSNEYYNVRLYIQTASQHGIILLLVDLPLESQYTTRNRQQNEVTVIAMRNGRIEYSIHKVTININEGELKLGSTVSGKSLATLLSLKSNTPVNDGQCHHIHAVRSGQKATLLVDNIMTPGEFVPQNSGSNTHNTIFLGSSPFNIAEFPWEYKENMTGCLADMFVNEQAIPLENPYKTLHPIEYCH